MQNQTNPAIGGPRHLRGRDARIFLLHSGGKAMNNQAGQEDFKRRVLVERMKGLREEVESEGDITRMLAPFPVLLAEVCETLGLCHAYSVPLGGGARRGAGVSDGVCQRVARLRVRAALKAPLPLAPN
jgi:hypothetical protein